MTINPTTVSDQLLEDYDNGEVTSKFSGREVKVIHSQDQKTSKCTSNHLKRTMQAAALATAGVVYCIVATTLILGSGAGAGYGTYLGCRDIPVKYTHGIDAEQCSEWYHCSKDHRNSDWNLCHLNYMNSCEDANEDKRMACYELGIPYASLAAVGLATIVAISPIIIAGCINGCYKQCKNKRSEPDETLLSDEDSESDIVEDFVSKTESEKSLV